MSWDWAFAIEIIPALIAGAWITILVTVASSLLALSLGLVIGIATTLAGGFGRTAIGAVIDFLRGVPIIVFLFFGYYSLPTIGVTLSGMAIGIFVIGVIYAAYCAEVYRGAFLSIPNGMREACLALGMRGAAMWITVLIPLAIKKSLPALVNNVLIISRQTTVLFAIGVPVLLARAQQTGYESFRYLEPYTLAGLLYFILNIPFIWIMHSPRFEKLRKSQ